MEAGVNASDAHSNVYQYIPRLGYVGAPTGAQRRLATPFTSFPGTGPATHPTPVAPPQAGIHVHVCIGETKLMSGLFPLPGGTVCPRALKLRTFVDQIIN